MSNTNLRLFVSSIIQLLFTYGTLQQPEVQFELFGRKLQCHDEILEGYKIKWVEISDERFLKRGENKIQRTLVFTGEKKDRIAGKTVELTPEELSQADSYEPDNYRRQLVSLQSGRQAWVYIAS